MLKITLVEPQKLVVGEGEIPVPKKGEVLIRVKRIGVCGSDPTIFFGRHPYVSYPLVMGHEFSGTIEQLGEGVKNLETGMRVTVIPHLVCGECEACKKQLYNFCEELRCTGAEADGAYCEYIAMPQEMVIPIPDTMTLEEAALVEPACVAYHGAKRGEITPEDTVLIIGAGPIGNFCMQSCKALGVKKVFIADMDGERLALAESLGADGIINVSQESLEDGLKRLCGGHKCVDVFYDCVGEKGTVLNNILSLARRGTRVVVVGVLQNGYNIPLLPDFVQHELRLSGTTMYTPKDYHEMIDHLGNKRIRTDGIITHHFPLRDVISVYDMISARKEKFFKIMLTLDDEV